MNNLGLIITIISGIITLAITMVSCTWVVSNRFAKIEAEMVGFREVMMAQNRRLERLESKMP